MTDSSTPKSTVQRLLDVGVFAPIGLVLKRDSVVQELADAGRKQVAFSRSLGRAALKGLAMSASASGAAKAAPAPSAPARQAAAAPGAASAAVDGYATMSARDLVALAGTCSDAEARWLLQQEINGKARVTVLRALRTRLD